MAETSINDSMLKAIKATKTDKSKSSSMKSDLNFQSMDWLSLLVAQLKNQDMYSQTDNSEMMSQMAQYSQIQAMQNMVSIQEDTYAMNTTSYASSLIGKDVTVASVEKTTDSSGTTEKLVTTKGKVTGVTLFEGEPVIYIGEKAFALAQIMIVGEIPEKDNTTNTKPADTSTDGTKPADTSTDGTKPADTTSGS